MNLAKQLIVVTRSQNQKNDKFTRLKRATEKASVGQIWSTGRSLGGPGLDILLHWNIDLAITNNLWLMFETHLQ